MEDFENIPEDVKDELYSKAKWLAENNYTEEEVEIIFKKMLIRESETYK